MASDYVAAAAAGDVAGLERALPLTLSRLTLITCAAAEHGTIATLDWLAGVQLPSGAHVAFIPAACIAAERGDFLFVYRIHANGFAADHAQALAEPAISAAVRADCVKILRWYAGQNYLRHFPVENAAAIAVRHDAANVVEWLYDRDLKSSFWFLRACRDGAAAVIKWFFESGAAKAAGGQLRFRCGKLVPREMTEDAVIESCSITAIAVFAEHGSAPAAMLRDCHVKRLVSGQRFDLLAWFARRGAAPVLLNYSREITNWVVHRGSLDLLDDFYSCGLIRLSGSYEGHVGTLAICKDVATLEWFARVMKCPPELFVEHGAVQTVFSGLAGGGPKRAMLEWLLNAGVAPSAVLAAADYSGITSTGARVSAEYAADRDAAVELVYSRPGAPMPRTSVEVAVARRRACQCTLIVILCGRRERRARRPWLPPELWTLIVDAVE